jgi:hypothetical protein
MREAGVVSVSELGCLALSASCVCVALARLTAPLHPLIHHTQTHGFTLCHATIHKPPLDAATWARGTLALTATTTRAVEPRGDRMDCQRPR